MKQRPDTGETKDEVRGSVWGAQQPLPSDAIDAHEQEKRQMDVDSDGFPTLSLPDLESFTDDEKLLARVTVGIARGGGAMYHGRFIECVVARLLDARFPLLGTSPWDLLLIDGIRFEVRSGATTFSLKGVKDIDLWVFVHKGSPNAFSVAAANDVAALCALDLRKKACGAIPTGRRIRSGRGCHRSSEEGR